MKKRVIVSVTNDLVTDQRVNKSCVMLMDLGVTPILVGRKLKESLPLERPYPTHRMRLLFRKKVWFYAEFQIRLFFFLLFTKADGLLANDLDTLLPNFIIAKIKGVPLVYDSHEYFCHTPELVHRPGVQNVWLRVERFIFPKLKHIITVNPSIAQQYKEEYGKILSVVRNITPFPSDIPTYDRSDWNLPEEAFIFINQGSGINVDRGMEEMVDALKYLPEKAILLVVGRGDVIPILKEKVLKENLRSRVIFIPPQPYGKLLGITRLADCGLSLDKTTNANYRFSLPNKLFDYIHAGLPVLGSSVVEVAKIIENHKIGLVIKNHDPEEIARQAVEIMRLGKSHYTQPLEKVAEIHNWEAERKKLETALTPLI
ncbi:MAG: glycosyltransferase [Cryomorphaceae bacterium]|nr:glycosyltransferase [Cryomorphaceae bacterium]